MWCGSIGKDAVRGKRSERQNYGALPAYDKNESWTPHDDACRGRLVNFGQTRTQRARPSEHLIHVTLTLPNDWDTNIPMGSCPRHEASIFVHTYSTSILAGTCALNADSLHLITAVRQRRCRLSLTSTVSTHISNQANRRKHKQATSPDNIRLT